MVSQVLRVRRAFRVSGAIRVRRVRGALRVSRASGGWMVSKVLRVVRRARRV